mmetsp:Transcript_19726/g.25542  ORF Transcript_19726/g.25542 Transcript_19726/m.25542 type:complete len:308 (-) Transcript_19726:545-1468(-)|eukprot:CAMPEP_0197318932 /NCGR_PEP_ID=MMETSP0891-20130614/52768_1 /TAXON_ID=44058 ORGANISM="Aureoumbra lagunensis, Strain CCMP1510" /NCGR_SAMPLE_ID=MMETSP0891 /ASSEMBLY_ACC=CAM_ASM_000534 /LENGTH=307 /DNA_ID=CAMNT_0042809585 /DNA_START=118 /DNA_END=1041 /DNA_ORIENTATION=+
MPNQKTRERKRRQQQEQEQKQEDVPVLAPPVSAETETVVPMKEKTFSRKKKGDRQRGVCRWFLEKKNYGFVSSNDENGDIFVHSKDLKEKIVEGDLVEYTLKESDGRLKAIEVIKIKENRNNDDRTQRQQIPPPPPPPPANIPPSDGKPTIAQAVVAPAPARATIEKSSHLKTEPTIDADQIDAKTNPNPNTKTLPQQKAHHPDERFTGSVLWYTSKKKHGFIKPDAPNVADIFVHALDIREGYSIAEDDRVEYGVGEFQGRSKATDVIQLTADGVIKQKKKSSINTSSDNPSSSNKNAWTKTNATT